MGKFGCPNRMLGGQFYRRISGPIVDLKGNLRILVAAVRNLMFVALWGDKELPSAAALLHNLRGTPQFEDRSVTARLGAVLGAGAYGTVHICLDENSGELLAVKQITCDLHDPGLKAKLKQLSTEVSIMRRLTHPRCTLAHSLRERWY